MTELIDEIKEAQQDILEAIARLRAVAKLDKQNGEWARRGIIAGLECAASSEHGWLSRDSNLSDWIEMLEGDEATQ